MVVSVVPAIVTSGMSHLDDYLSLPEPSLNRLVFIAGTVVYFLALGLSYAYLISPTFGYLGAVYRPEGTGVILVSAVLALLPSVWVPVQLDRPSQVIYVLLYLMVMVPTLLVGTLAGVFSLSRILLFGTLLIVVFGALQFIYRVPTLDLPKVVETSTGFWLILAAFAIGLYGILIAKYGVYTQIPSFSDVYTQRGEFRRVVSGVGAYLFFWTAKAINPFFLAKGYVDRSLPLFTIGILGQLWLFALSGLKSVLFSFLLLGAILIALWRDGQFFGNWVVWGLVGIIGLTSAVDTYLGATITSSLFVRRLLVVPGLNTAFYFDFFSTNPHVFLGHSILDWAVTYPYETRPAMVIGDAYYGHVQGPINMSANANLWADAYANFGVLGILLFTAILGGFLWTVDSVAKGVSLKISTLLLAYPAYMLVNTKLQTTLLTHGLILVFAILYILPRRTNSDDHG